MNRYIDADALIKSIESDRNCSDMPSQWIDGVNYAIDLIELYEPTIDAASVVRCKDCKFNGAWCDIQEIQWSGYDKPVEWCSYGEVRDE